MSIESLRKYETGVSGKVVRTQTTFLDLECSLPSDSAHVPSRYRIHYHQKHEFSLHLAPFTSLRIEREHPLLLQYAERMDSLELVSEVRDKPRFIAELNKAAIEVFNGWRNAESYSLMPLEEFIKESYGILMIAPRSYADAVLKAAERCDVKLALHGGNQPMEPFPAVLLLDNMYVVADEFRIEHLP